MSRMCSRLILFFVLIMVCFHSGNAQTNEASLWVDSCMNNMTLDQKIGQLFMIRAHSDLGPDHIKSVENQIQEFHIGGMCFFQGTPRKQAELSNQYQKLSKIPLMIAMDAEWGLGMRHKKTALSYPKQMTLGAINNNTLIYDMGADIASQLRRIGSHINFAPVADVNNNPANPVIHNRSFGEDIYNVATKSYAYMKGLQDHNVMACAKHFPGHGDTGVDSHYNLPVLTHSIEILDSLELMPFRVLTQLGIQSMMSAHLSIPVLDDRPNRPSSLSEKVITGLLRNQMHFDGLLFTDGLEMKGVANQFEPGDIEVEAIKAGNDVLLLPIDIEKAFNKIKDAVLNGDIPVGEINQKVEKILKAKYTLKLHKDKYVTQLDAIDQDINRNESKALISKLFEKAMTLAVDDLNFVPLHNDVLQETAMISLGTDNSNAFQSMLSKYGIETGISVGNASNEKEVSEVISALRPYKNIIVSIHDMSIYKSKDYGISKNSFDLIYRLNSEKNVILVLFGTPYALEYFKDLPAALVAYEDNVFSQEAAAQALMGATKIEGQLPVSVGDKFRIKSGITRAGLQRLGYAIPEAVGLSSDSLKAIDTIINEMLATQAAPGCQILAARNGRIFFNKSYGKHTPDGRLNVTNENIYDVASVTKILASTISIMKLYEEGQINLYGELSDLLPETDTTNKGDLIVEDILAHHSGLPGWIPFYERTLDQEKNNKPILQCYYSETLSDTFCINVCDHMYLRSDWRDSIYQIIYNCDLRESKDYRYSDLGFYLFQQVIERKSGMPLDKYVDSNFYKPLNLRKTGFNPHQHIPKNQIIPSEKDDYYRNCVLHGYVHDMGAAMLGGVAGHAGLFSNASELAVLMQMLLNGGSYGGTQFLKPETISRFTRKYYRSSRRGLGFDMKETDPEKTMNMSEKASPNTFGHLGFTGIAVFADPEYDMIYIMLSNRTYPTMKNYKFAKENYRPRVQSVFYNAIKKKES